MTKPLTTIIRFVGINRKTRALAPVYVTGVKFADGPGYRVKSISYSTDRAKAMTFSVFVAGEIAEQYFRNPAYLENLSTGAVLEAESEKLQERQRAKVVADRILSAEYDAIQREMANELRKIIGRMESKLATL